MPRSTSEEYSNNIDRGRDSERSLLIGRKRPIRISTGHRIQGHDGKCRRPHGHNYAITIEITGELTPEGWIVDKGQVTDLVDEWDHRFLLEAGDPLVNAFRTSGDIDAVVVLEQPPTAEVMSLVLEQRLLATLPNTVTDVAVQVRETAELCAGSPL